MSRARRIAFQLPLGLSSGLPLLLTGSTLTAWLADEGVDLKAIGLFALVSLPYNVKFLWAPLLDRFALPGLGRRRGWMLATQLLLMLAIAALAGMEPHASLALAVAAVAVAILSASQDIVVDAYRTELLPGTERGKGSAMYVTGYRIGMIVAGSGALVLADHVSWQTTYLLLAALMAVGVVATLLAPATPAVAPPRTVHEAVIAPLGEFFTRERALIILAFILLYRVGDSLVGHMLTPFLLSVSFTKTEIGVLQKFLGLAATIAGVGLGGVLADRIGTWRALIYFGLLQAVANAGYLLLAVTGKSTAALVVAITVDQVCNGLGTAALVVFLMALCHQRFSATQYALFTSASTVLGRFLSSVSGYLIVTAGWTGFFVASIVIALPALVLLRWVPHPREASVTDGEGADAAP